MLLLAGFLFAPHHITAGGFPQNHAPGAGGIHEGKFASHGTK